MVEVVVARVLYMLPLQELSGEAPLVCRAWRKAATIAFAEVASGLAGGGGGGGGGGGEGKDQGRQR